MDTLVRRSMVVAIVAIVAIASLVLASAAAATTRETCNVKIANHRIAVRVTARPDRLNCARIRYAVTSIYDDAVIQDGIVVTFTSGAWHCHTDSTYTSASYAVIACTSPEFHQGTEGTIRRSRVTMSYRLPVSIGDRSCPRESDPSAGIGLEASSGTINSGESCGDLGRFAYVLFNEYGFGEPPNSWSPFTSTTTGANQSEAATFDFVPDNVSAVMPGGRYSCTMEPLSKTTRGSLNYESGAPVAEQDVTTALNEYVFCQRVQRYPRGNGLAGQTRYETLTWTWTAKQTGLLVWYVGANGSLTPIQVTWNQCAGGNWCSPPPSI